MWSCAVRVLYVYAVVLEEIHLRCLWAERGFRLEGRAAEV